MGWSKSAVNSTGLKFIIAPVISAFALLALLGQLVQGITNPHDVAAINSLYAAFGNPPLTGWVATGGDPCGGAWQGVQCNPANNIISISLINANLGGGLGDNLGSFSSITLIDLSNNHIGGSIPTSLPISLRNFFLSGNNFTGSIPSSLSSLTQLFAVKLNNNHLTGKLPDAFKPLLLLAIVDLSSNKLSGELPSSMAKLSSLVNLHLQNNQLSGTLHVLQDLPLQDLDVSNNLFSGPIPEKLLTIPYFKRDGNPFNTSAPPSSSPPPSTQPILSTPPMSSLTPPPSTPPVPSIPSSPSPPPKSSQTSPPSATPDPSVPPPPSQAPISSKQPSPFSPSSSDRSPSSSLPHSPPSPYSSPSLDPGKEGDASAPSSTPRIDQIKSKTSAAERTKKVVLISIASAAGFIILLFALLLCLPSCFRRSRKMYYTYQSNNVQPYKGGGERRSPARPSIHLGKVQKDLIVGAKEEARPESDRKLAAVAMRKNDETQWRETSLRNKESKMGDTEPTRVPPPEFIPFSGWQIVKSTTSESTTRAQAPLTSVKSFTVASLQQYTNSFSQDNLIGNGMLGSVYRAKLPNGKLLAVKYLDKEICSRLEYHKFIELVNDIDRIRHANVVELLGYCAEHGQRLLIYEYCSNGTLQDALHSTQLSWGTRMQIALGVARALEYLHEKCEPPIVHQNLKHANILLDDDCYVHVSDCGLGSLIASGSVAQSSEQLLSTYGYEAPDFGSGIYTSKTDVYCLGVLMLELLTGRKSYDSTLSHGQRFLVRWAIPQLHDIEALSRMVDPSLSGKYPTKSLSYFADIIFRCVQNQPEFRPLMSEVVQDLLRMIQRGSH